MTRSRWLVALMLCLVVAPLPAAVRLAAALPRAVAAGPDPVLTERNDNGRTGAYLGETTLTTANVNVGQFGKLFTRAADGDIYAQPLYVPGLSINGAVHNVIFVATQHNSVYAYDADDPAAAAPLWTVNLGPSAPVPNADFGNRYGPYHDIAKEIGITSTPVIDLASMTLYVVAFTKETTGYVHRLHALDLLTGHEKFGGPVVLAAAVAGTGDASVGGTVTFDTMQHLQRSSLLLANGTLYITFASHADTDPYHGWVMGYNAQTLQQVAVWNDTPNGSEGGIWQSGWAPAADPNGTIYLITGNGTWDAGSGGADFGDSVVKLSPSLAVTDWFTPYNQATLSAQDLDLGSSGVLLVPGTTLMVGGGKQGVLYLLDRGNLGHFNAGSDNVVQSFLATAGHIHGGPIFWAGATGSSLYVWSENDYLKAFRFASGRLSTAPTSQSTMMVPPGMPGGILSLSANGSVAGSGIVWASHPFQGDANTGTVPGILRAFDAADLSKELWNSKQNALRDDVGNFAKFTPPTIANGKVYMATFSGDLVVYGLLAAPTATPSSTAVPTATASPTTTPTRTPAPTATSTATPVAPATLVVSPTHAVVGQGITLTGASFKANEPVNVYWDALATPLVTTGGDATGSFTAHATVPQATRGGHTLTAVGQTSGITATAQLVVTPWLYAPSSGRVGVPSRIYGLGFGAREAVSVWWSTTPATYLGTAFSSGAGTAALTYTPTVTGTYYLLGVGQTSHAVGYGVFTVR